MQLSLYLVSWNLSKLPLSQLLVEVFSGGGWFPVDLTLLKERDFLAHLSHLALGEKSGYTVRLICFANSLMLFCPLHTNQQVS